MPPLGEISGNSRRGPEMTPYERGRMVQGNCDGLSIHEIGRQLNRPYETIKSSLKVIPVRKDGESLPRNGAPSLLTERQTRAILHTVYRTPKVSYKDLLTQVGLGPRNQYTVYRCLKEHGITNWRSKKRPFLTSGAAKIRRTWAETLYTMLGWNPHLPDYICWSDECSIYQQGGLIRTWSFGPPERKWDKECVDAVQRERGPHVMVWACFCRGRRSKLMFMERDPDSPRAGYTSVSYTDVLAKELQRFMRADNFYMHDNAPIYTSRWANEWLRSRDISMFEPCWPPWSPDLNPIEHVWHKLRDTLQEIDPTLHEAKGSEEVIYARLKASLEATWEAIPQTFFDALVDTWFHRVDAVRLANGWYTKY